MSQILTNRRLVNSTTANISSADLQIEQYNIKSGEVAIGIFGETEVSRDGSTEIDDSHHH